MYSRHLIFIISPVLFSSCAMDDSSRSSAEASKFGPSKSAVSFASAPALSGSITRQKAISHALKYSPSLQSQRAELRALEAEIIQAGLPPNPELGVDIENFAGSGGLSGFDGAEITALLSQRLELGGKRNKRTLVATLEAKALRAEIANDERELRIATDRAYTTLVETRQIRELNEQNVTRAEKGLSILNSLLEAGKSNRIDVSKAKLAASAARELLAKARSAESIAASELSQTWGGGAANVTATGSLAAPSGSIPTNAKSAIHGHPAMRAAGFHFARAQATYDLENARRFSNVEVGAGVRELRDADATAAVIGIKIPLPIFDRNQGNIQAAKERLDRARAEGRTTESKLRSRFTKLSADLRAARSRAAEFDSRTIAAARQALKDTRDAYVVGKASILEVLDARETLFDVERGQARAQADLLRSHHSLRTLTNN